jgi:hypothetical protein
LTLATTEVDEWHRYLSGQGVTFEKPPALNPNYNIYPYRSRKFRRSLKLS